MLSSYKPGVTLGDWAPVLPAYAVQALREALCVFGQQTRAAEALGCHLLRVPPPAPDRAQNGWPSPTG